MLDFNERCTEVHLFLLFSICVCCNAVYKTSADRTIIILPYLICFTVTRLGGACTAYTKAVQEDWLNRSKTVSYRYGAQILYKSLWTEFEEGVKKNPSGPHSPCYVSFSWRHLVFLFRSVPLHRLPSPSPLSYLWCRDYWVPILYKFKDYFKSQSLKDFTNKVNRNKNPQASNNGWKGAS